MAHSPRSPGGNPPFGQRVTADTLTPQQQPTPIRQKIAEDYRERYMLKYPGLAQFHNYCEYLYGALLEGDPTVPNYVPHPFRLRVGKYLHLPSFFVVRAGYHVISIQRGGDLDRSLREPLTEYLALQRMRFEVIGEDAIKARRIEAENWQVIVHALYLARDLITEADEQALSERLLPEQRYRLDALIDPGDRLGTYSTEIALLRLLHRGLVRAELDTAPLDYDTQVWLCR